MLEPEKYKALVDHGVQCTQLPSNHKGTERVIISGVTGGFKKLTALEAKLSLTDKKWERHSIVTDTDVPCVLGIDFLRKRILKRYWWVFGIAAVDRGQ